jgi:hypothetical protein
MFFNYALVALVLACKKKKLFKLCITYDYIALLHIIVFLSTCSSKSNRSISKLLLHSCRFLPIMLLSVHIILRCNFLNYQQQKNKTACLHRTDRITTSSILTQVRYNNTIARMRLILL